MICPDCGCELIFLSGCWSCRNCGYEDCRKNREREPHGNLKGKI